MKTKKIISACALVLTAALLCGCASKTKVQLDNYWSESIASETVSETLVYDVTFQANETNYGFELSYENGQYQTELTSGADETGRKIYTYKTSLTIDVIYTFDGVSTQGLTDTVTSEVTFLTADNGLFPISSRKTVKSHSPIGSAPETLEDCYTLYEYTSDIDYTETSGVSTLTMGEQMLKQSFEIDEDGYRYLDNEQLLLSLRAISANTSSARIRAYSPFASSVQTVAISFSSAASGEFTFTKNGSEEKVTETISYRPVQMKLDENNSGTTQTAWIASTTDSYNNKYRNVMLKLETPIAYNLGTLVYTLSSVSF